MHRFRRGVRLQSPRASERRKGPAGRYEISMAVLSWCERFRFKQPARICYLVLCGHQLDLSRARFRRLQQHTEYTGCCLGQRLADVPAAQVMREKKGGDGIARAIDRERQLRCSYPETAALIRRQQIDRIF